MKRIVIPVLNNKLSEHFTKCSHYEIFEIYKEHISKKEISNSNRSDNTIDWLFALEASDIITYYIDNKLIKLLSNTKINLFVGIAINSPEAIIESYLNGRLKSDLKMINELTNSK